MCPQSTVQRVVQSGWGMSARYPTMIPVRFHTGTMLVLVGQASCLSRSDRQDARSIFGVRGIVSLRD